MRPEGPKREARRAESWGEVLGEGAASPFPTSWRSGERCKLPQRGPGRSPGRKRILDVEDPIKRI